MSSSFDFGNYSAFGDPNPSPSAQNPTLIPNTDPWLQHGEDGQGAFTSPALMLQQYPRVPAQGTVTFTGSVTTNDTAFIILANNLLPQGSINLGVLATSTDTLTTLAQKLTDTINTNSVLNRFQVVASLAVVSSNPVITLNWPGILGNFTTMSGVSSASSATVVIGGTKTTGDLLTLGVSSATLPANNGIVQMLGTAVTGDVVTLTLYNPSLTNGNATVSFTVAGTQTLAAIATGLASAVNASSTLTALGVTANATEGSLYLSWNPIYGTIGAAISATRAATETLTVAVNTPSAPSALAPAPLPSFAVTVGGSSTTGDVLSLTIAASQVQPNPVIVRYTVPSGSPSTTTMAAGLATAINTNPTLQAAGFSATSTGAVVTAAASTLAGNIAIAGSAFGVATEYANVSMSPSRLFVPRTAQSGDSTASIATAFNTAINANVALAAAGISSTVTSSTLTIAWNGTLNPLSFVNSANGVSTLTVGGSVTAGDLLTLTTTDTSMGNPQSVSYTTVAGDTTTAIATAFKNLINANLPMAAVGITASSSSAVVSITSLSFDQTSFAVATSNGATETLTLGAGATETFTVTQTVPVQTVTVGGSVTAGDNLSLKFADGVLGDQGPIIVNYQTIAGDTTSTAASGLAGAINANNILQSVGITATASSAVVTIATAEQDPVPTLTKWLNPADFTNTMTGTPTAGDVVNTKLTNATFAGGSYTVQYQVQSTDTSLTILAASMASAINANATSLEWGVTATSSAGVVAIKVPSVLGATTISANVNGVETATLGGTTTSTDVITITVTDASVAGSPLAIPYAVVSGDTTLTILAGNIAALLESTVALTAAGITTTSNNAVISITSKSLTKTTYAQAVTGGSPTETVTLASLIGETATAAGSASETLTIANPSAGSEVLTATSPLTGGNGPVIPTANFQLSQCDQMPGNETATGTMTDFWINKPALVSFSTAQVLVDNQMPVI